MSDYNRYGNNQPDYSGGGERQGGMSDADMERRYAEQQRHINPDQALLQGALADPYMSQYLANQVRQNMMGGQQQQQPQDPLAEARQRVETAKTRAQELRSVAETDRNYGAIYEADNEVQQAELALMRAEQDLRYNQQTQMQNNQQVQQIYAGFLLSTFNRLGIPEGNRQQLGEEFTMMLRSAWAQDVLSDPQRLQAVLPDQWNSFAYQKNLPRPGQVQGQQRQPSRQGEEYNGAQAPAPQTPDPNDPLARLAGMNNRERALMKEFYYNKGQYDIANKITNEDGSPILDRRTI